MRRSVSPLALITFGFGIFLLVLAPMLAWYVEPRAKRTPIDTDVTTVFTGPGSYFDTEAVEVRQDQRLTITRHVLGDVGDSDRDTAVWDVSTTIDTPRSLPLKDPRKSLQWTTERWVTDRRTNAPVHCCGEAPRPFQGEAYLKFPFDVEKRSYRWWDSTLKGSVPLRFAGTTEIQGYRGYRFTGSVPPTEIGSRQVPGRLVGAAQGQVHAEEWYSNGRIELVADRRTGRIIHASVSPRLALRAPGGKGGDKVVLLHGKGLEFTPATQRSQVALARDDNDRLELVGRTAPIAAAVTGGVLTAAGVWLLVRGRVRGARH
ncbi:DUF3068 domain-containing protein [Streptomyces pactum]|uniref:DUF3068 domain-containing protein n=1 Tax=Streptomyces pactum TaxID=68249 RepID=A0ABS0NHR1_9ACTN|nr:DUF3068 domain-containing protein [Streptomyces pactum]MBH5334667.1 DUF3068 domain-containing protein [Streptomyces pactum]